MSIDNFIESKILNIIKDYKLNYCHKYSNRSDGFYCEIGRMGNLEKLNSVILERRFENEKEFELFFIKNISEILEKLSKI